jgi:hypothetical protein
VNWFTSSSLPGTSTHCSDITHAVSEWQTSHVHAGQDPPVMIVHHYLSTTAARANLGSSLCSHSPPFCPKASRTFTHEGFDTSQIHRIMCTSDLVDSAKTPRKLTQIRQVLGLDDLPIAGVNPFRERHDSRIATPAISRHSFHVMITSLSHVQRKELKKSLRGDSRDIDNVVQGH